MVPLRALSHEQQTNGMHARAMNIAELWPTVLSHYNHIPLYLYPHYVSLLEDKIPIKLPCIIKSHDTNIFDGYISIFDG